VKIFYVNRSEDATDVGGTAQLAVGVVFPDGLVVVRCHTKRGSILVYNSIEDLKTSHLNHVATKTTWVDSIELPWGPVT
jgi:hypothetical protein